MNLTQLYLTGSHPFPPSGIKGLRGDVTHFQETHAADNVICLTFPEDISFWTTPISLKCVKCFEYRV